MRRYRPRRHVAKSVGIDVHDIGYWRSALDVLRSEIDEFEALAAQKGKQ